MVKYRRRDRLWRPLLEEEDSSALWSILNSVKQILRPEYKIYAFEYSFNINKLV